MAAIQPWLSPPGQFSSLIRWICLLLAIFGIYQIISSVRKRQRMKGAIYPPGPKSWPLLGRGYDFVQLKGSYLHLITSWADQYGPITQFSIGSDKHVIISDHNIAKELFVNRGSKYGDRWVPHAVEWATMNQNPALRTRDEGWRRERTFIHNAISSAANRKYRDTMDEEANITLNHLMQNPESTRDPFKRFTYSVLTHTLMGLPLSSATDPFIVAHEQFKRKFVSAYSLVLFPSNLFKVFRKLPSWLTPNVSIMEKLKNENLEHVLSIRQKIERSLKDGSAGESPFEQVLRNRQDYSVTDEELAFTFQALVGAGVTGPFQTQLIAATLLMEHPEWQERLHADIDRVVGEDRLPGFDDIPNLPVLRAIYKECIRYRSVITDTELPRKLVEDDIYQGYFFEKGTIFHMNFSAFLVDKDLYPDGELFNPARWLEPSYPTYKEPLTVYPNCQNFAAFGYGRRQCAGVDFTEQTGIIMLLKLCWAFSMVRPETKEGKDTLRSNIMDYNFKLQIRNKSKIELVRKIVEAA